MFVHRIHYEFAQLQFLIKRNFSPHGMPRAKDESQLILTLSVMEKDTKLSALKTRENFGMYYQKSS